MDLLTFIFGLGVEGLSVEDAAKRSTRRYTRSEGGLAVYDKERNSAGHVLTAWEAYTAFGADALEEAVEWSSAILLKTANATGAALKERRELLGLSNRSIATAARVPETDVKTAQERPGEVSIQSLERIAFTLGLDERFLAFSRRPGADDKLAYRLRTLQHESPANASGKISARTALRFAEAASIIRVQRRFQNWLGIESETCKFNPHRNYGSPQTPAWQVGYNLARSARNALGLGNEPIGSMRELAENRLGIPVIQARLPKGVAGATVMSVDERGEETRGVVLNTLGENENVWVRRATLAHEIGHLLYDPDEQLQRVRMDSYDGSQQDAQAYEPDYVEQRANAFAIALLAPNEAVRELAPTPVTEESVSNVMRVFGISHTAAKFHINNCLYRAYDVPDSIVAPDPSDEQKADENFTADYFPISSTPEHRRGKFAGVTAAAYEENFISDHTGALYLECKPEDFRANSHFLRELYEV